MANHALPTTTSLYTDVLTNLKDRIDDSLKMLDSVNTTPTNVPTNSVRFNSTTFLWEKYNGSAWVSLASSYAIKVSKSINLTGGNSTTLLGAIHYQSNTDTSSILSPNTTTTRKFLRQTGTGTNGAAPVWDTILAADIPTLNQNTTGSAATLTTARTINGVSFNGSANINIEDIIGTPIASATTTTIGTAGLGDYIHITGTTTITSLGTAERVGIRRTLIFDGSLTVTHNATSLICPGATSIITVAGTVIEVVAETTSNWRVVSITHPNVSHTELEYLDGVTSAIQTQINEKQATLVSGTNIKTINSNSILGSGDIVVGETAWTANDSRAKTALNASGTAPIYACRAWVNFNGTGTVAIRGSGNVSSITDNGTGDYSINFTTAMPDVNYGFSQGSGKTGNSLVCACDNDMLRTVTSLRLQTAYVNNGLTDSIMCCISIFI